MNTTMPMMPYAMGGANNGLFGGNGFDLIGFAFLALIFGWGGNGFGFGGGRGAGNPVTDNLISNEFNYNTLNNGIRGIEKGICDLGYSMAQQSGQTREAITNSTYGITGVLSDLGSKLDNCCCNTNRNIDSVRYDMSKGFCDVITSQNMNTRDILLGQERQTQKLLDAMTQSTIQDLRDKNTALALQVSQQAQTASIIDALKPCPKPAYIVQNPCCNGGF